MTLTQWLYLLRWVEGLLLDWPRHAFWACWAVLLLCGPILTTYHISCQFYSQKFMAISERYHLDFFIKCSFVSLWLLLLSWQHLRVDALWP